MAPPPPDEGTGITLGELSRTVQDVLLRVQGVVTRLEQGQYVRSDIFDLYKQSQDAKFNTLQTEVNELKDDKKWLIRAVLLFVILGILGATFVVKGSGG
jgi:hypothetical protein